ncbi:hypothetical protein [Janibacter limosus]|uniref:hypothetical protein n=1 Tax=Janibacter limosus TaxID=53458 RepID=UPI00082CE325|nr:hypothetical protein [Janibacter limosus]
MSTKTTETTIETTDLVCECCAVALVNDDTSGCAWACMNNHVEKLGRYAEYPETARVVYLDWEGPTFHGSFVCAGCGENDPRGYAGRVEITTQP